jgi:hypothetical protein
MLFLIYKLFHIIVKLKESSWKMIFANDKIHKISGNLSIPLIYWSTVYI